MFLTIYGCVVDAHDWRLVLLAALICAASTSAIFKLFARARARGAVARYPWLAAAALSTGGGVWATHFIAMLAFEPDYPTGYDVGLTALSIIVATLVSGIGLAVASTGRHLALGGAFVGTAITAMHFIGMAALHIPAQVAWDRSLVALSFVIGIAFAAASFAVPRHLHQRIGHLAGAALLALAIWGMHFTAMAAMILTPDPRLALPSDSLAPHWLGFAVTGIAVLISAMALFGSFVDQRAAEQSARDAEALRQAHRQLSAIFESSAQGICMVSRRTRGRIFTACNHAFEALYGYGPGELVGRNVRICFADDTAYAAYDSQRGEAFARGETFTAESLRRRKDGSDVWVRTVGRALDPQDPEAAAVYVAEDVTERRRADAMLREAMQSAEEATRLKSDFVANISHEIRTPMNTILGMAHLAMRTGLTPRQDDYVRKIQRAGQHLLRILDDILDFSKIEAGKLTIERTVFAVEDVLDNVAALTGEKASAKGLELVFDVDPAVPTDLIGDPLRLGQILVNYTTNAIKFTQTGEISIRVTVQRETERGTELQFAVNDTGIGLTAAQIARLFSPFVQADGSTTRCFGGTGLGLAITKRLAELMDGTVGVTSEPGKGSCFWFTGPFGRGPSRRRLLPRPDIRNRRVLVVDDNEHARAVLSQMLDGLTFRVEEADSGSQALALARDAANAGDPFEAIFLDWHMPGMHGIDVARCLTALRLEPPPHLAMVTAYGRDEVLAKAHEAGIEAILVKPVAPSLLLDTMMELMGSERRGRPAEPESRAITSALDAIAGAHILLVEDNELNQEVALGLLTQAGMLVDVARDGASACRMLDERIYDLVLMDMHMPVMDGLTATRRIREAFHRARLPIVAMTASAMTRDRDACLAAGMNDFVAKPIEPDALMAALVRWIQPGDRRPVPRVMTDVSSTDSPAFDGLEGVDSGAALAHMNGDRALYRTLLEMFVASQKSVAAGIETALAGGDGETAERLAHTAKGVAAAIGATTIQSHAAVLEAAIGGQPTMREIPALLSQFRTELGRTVTSIERWLAASDTTSAADAEDPAPLADVLRELNTRLTDHDPGAADLCRDHAGLLKSAFGARYAAIQSAITRYDFDSALAALRVLDRVH